MPSHVASTSFRYMNNFFEIAGTFLYRELFKRNTLRPMKRIIRESSRPELQHRLLRQWAQTKFKESQYIQVAQLLLLPNENDPYMDDGFDALNAIDTRYTSEEEAKQTEVKYLNTVVKRLTTTKHNDRPNPILVFALQAPLMLLTLSVMSFLTGLSAVVFAPLANQKGWGNDANIALLFGIAGFLCLGIFVVSSYLVHGLFSIRLEPTPWSIERLGQIQNVIFPSLSDDPEIAKDQDQRNTESATDLHRDGHSSVPLYDKPTSEVSSLKNEVISTRSEVSSLRHDVDAVRRDQALVLKTVLETQHKDRLLRARTLSPCFHKQ
ncbi:MAG: hypothetical protein Q9216_004853 [Gyalolechia sp. 2 TL-2023]